MKEKQDGGQEELVRVMCVNANLANSEGPAKHSDTAKRDPTRSENDGASSCSTNESENKKSSKSKVLLVSDSLLHKLDVKRFFVKGSETVKLAKSGDTVNGTSERAFSYMKEHKDVFEAIVLLAGTNDIKSKSASTTTNSIAQELLKTAQDLLSKDNVTRVFICKIPPRLDNQMVM